VRFLKNKIFNHAKFNELIVVGIVRLRTKATAFSFFTNLVISLEYFHSTVNTDTGFNYSFYKQNYNQSGLFKSSGIVLSNGETYYEKQNIICTFWKSSIF
jgi:hypothetical protein